MWDVAAKAKRASGRRGEATIFEQNSPNGPSSWVVTHYRTASRWAGANRSIIMVGVMAVAFALAYTIQPLFYSNQNTYLAHAVAAVPGSRLGSDWFIGTADALPVFSALLAVLLMIGDWSVYLATLAVFAVYFVALYLVAHRASGMPKDHSAAWALAAALVVVHTPFMEGLGARNLTQGVAEQLVLGPAIQPSVSGVLMIVAIALFQRDRLRMAAVTLGLTPLLHGTYLASVCILAAGFALSLLREPRRSPGVVLQAGALFVFLLVAATGVAARVLQADTPGLIEQARNILVDFRIPHHAEPAVWLRTLQVPVAVVLVAGAAIASRDQRTRHLLAASLAMIVVLTIAAMMLDSDVLKLLFPWRLSTVLVPVSAATLIGFSGYHLTSWLMSRWQPLGRLIPPLAALTAAACAVGGVLVTADRFSRGADTDERRVAALVRDQGLPGAIYLVDPDWSAFRLASAAAIVVDMKSNPYAPGDVVEWWSRVQTLNGLYDGPDGRCADWTTTMARYGATAVVSPLGRLDGCPGLCAVAEVGNQEIHRLCSVN